jgi:hypothetical protein
MSSLARHRIEPCIVLQAIAALLRRLRIVEAEKRLFQDGLAERSRVDAFGDAPTSNR